MFRTKTTAGALAVLGGIWAMGAWPGTAAAQCYDGRYYSTGHRRGYSTYSRPVASYTYSRPARSYYVAEPVYYERPVYIRPTPVVRRARHYRAPVRTRTVVTYGRHRSARRYAISHSRPRYSSGRSYYRSGRSYHRPGWRSHRSHHGRRHHSRGISFGIRW